MLLPSRSRQPNRSSRIKRGRPGADRARTRELLFNADLTAGVAFPTIHDPVYISDGDGDQLVYVHEGGGTLRTLLGDVEFAQGDYVFVPRGLLHRFLTSGEQHWLWFELFGGLHLPKQWRNEVGQLRMDAPYSVRGTQGDTDVPSLIRTASSSR